MPEDAAVVQVPRDGSCMFHAAFVAFYHAKKGHLIDPSKNVDKMRNVAEKLRASVVMYILKNYRRPLGGVPGNITGKDLVHMEYVYDPEIKNKVKGPGTYKDYMSCYTTFAGETELHGLSGILHCGIVVHPFGISTQEACQEGQYYNVAKGPEAVRLKRADPDDVIIHLSFDELGQHYSAIVETKKSG